MITDIENIEFFIRKLTFDDIVDLIPGWLHLNNTNDFGLEYMSPKMEKDFNTTIEKVKKEGIHFLNECLHPETSERIVPQLIQLVKSGNKSRILSFYQFIKLPEKDFAWYLTSSKLFNGEYVISTTIPLSDLQDFNDKVIDVLTENLFLKSNLEKFNTLTKREKEVIKNLTKGISNSQIAELLNVSEYTIKTHRQNIYRKLAISNICELLKFANTYNLK
jgi:DNA-binding CsgD family transcriptional regulator